VAELEKRIKRSEIQRDVMAESLEQNLERRV